MIRKCTREDGEAIFAIINDAAQAYRGIIPEDRWHEPYMSMEELRREIERGVEFWGYEDWGELKGVMGKQNVKDVTLIRHAYVRMKDRRCGIGGRLLRHLLRQAEKPVLVGTWAAATWAISFYQKHGFVLVTPAEKNRLLKDYWAIPERQIETSVVLADSHWVSSKTHDFPTSGRGNSH